MTYQIQLNEQLKNILRIGPNLLSIHLSGGSEMIKEVSKIKGETKIIGVTMLTSLEKNDLEKFGIQIPEYKFVENLVNIGLNSGIDDSFLTSRTK